MLDRVHPRRDRHRGHVTGHGVDCHPGPETLCDPHCCRQIGLVEVGHRADSLAGPVADELHPPPCLPHRLAHGDRHSVTADLTSEVGPVATLGGEDHPRRLDVRSVLGCNLVGQVDNREIPPPLVQEQGDAGSQRPARPLPRPRRVPGPIVQRVPSQVRMGVDQPGKTPKAFEHMVGRSLRIGPHPPDRITGDGLAIGVPHRETQLHPARR